MLPTHTGRELRSAARGGLDGGGSGFDTEHRLSNKGGGTDRSAAHGGSVPLAASGLVGVLGGLAVGSGAGLLLAFTEKLLQGLPERVPRIGGLAACEVTDRCLTAFAAGGDLGLTQPAGL
jgi:hypothetical protein